MSQTKPTGIKPLFSDVAKGTEFYDKLNMGAKIAASLEKPSNSPKRKNDGQNVDPPQSKMNRLDTSTIELVGKSLLEQFLPQVQSIVDNAAARIENKVDLQLGALQTRMDALELAQTETSDRLDKIEAVPPPLVLEEVRATIIPEVTQSLHDTILAQWNSHLVDEIAKLEPCLVIKGVNPTKISEPNFFSSFCLEQLKMPREDLEKIQFKDLFVLNKKATSPLICVTLCNAQQRNICLALSRNLPRGVSLDKFVPKAYLAKYEDFKKKAWQLRTIHKVQTRIDFNGPILTLRYKTRDTTETKYSFIIHSEYTPPPQTPKVKSSVVTPEGLVPSTPLPICHVAIMTNIDGIDPKASPSPLFDLFTPNDKLCIEKISMQNSSTAIIYCKDPDSRTKIVEAYHGKQLNSKKVSFISAAN